MHAQRDTIYLDYNWSICQQPVASYYRICAINKGKFVFYTGPFEDYYVNGKIEMIGSYDSKGLKEGVFTAYYPNGNMKFEVNYKSDMPNGSLFFYNEDGKLKLKLNCKNSRDFTPVFLVDNNRDTLVKDGNGKFILEKDDYPELFSKTSSCTMEGSIVNGEKDGTIYYYSCSGIKKVDYQEVYKKGVFKSSTSGISQTAEIPFGTMELTLNKLENVDAFYHANPLFGDNKNADKLALDFIVNKNFYGVASNAKSFDENCKDFYGIVAYVLNASISGKNNFAYPFSLIADDERVVFDRISFNDRESFHPRLLNGSIAVTIDTSGYVSNSTFKGNFRRDEIDKINYYLSVLYDLKPFVINAEKVNKDVNLKVYNYIDSTSDGDTLKNYQCLYVIEDADKTYTESLDLLPQITPQFPGGQSAWIKYLQKNLRADIPSENRAPNGTYTVTVSFHVDEKGNISQVKALNDPGYGTAEEAIRVIKSGPPWVPAVLNGKNIACKQKQKITFQINGF